MTSYAIIACGKAFFLTYFNSMQLTIVCKENKQSVYDSALSISQLLYREYMRCNALMSTSIYNTLLLIMLSCHNCGHIYITVSLPPLFNGTYVSKRCLLHGPPCLPI